MPKRKTNNKKIIALAKPYTRFIIIILFLSLLANGLNLALPKMIASTIDAFNRPNFNLKFYTLALFSISGGIFFIFLIQNILQAYLSEFIAKDLRNKLIERISLQQFSFVSQTTPEKLLTNLTSDIDNIKQVISLGLIQIFSSVIIILGAVALLLSINWKLSIIVFLLIPIIGSLFFTVFKKIRKYFKKSQAIIDSLNKTINESIVASALIRILNSQQVEIEKFTAANNQAKDVGVSIVNLFSSLIPLISIVSNAAVVLILYFGGRSIIVGTFTIGNLTAFISYISMLIFPIIVLGFISNAMARAAVSYERISEVFAAPLPASGGKIKKNIKGEIEFKNVDLYYGEKQVLKNVSFEIKAGSRTAILGPTAAGKSQIFYILANLIRPNSGKVLIDKIPLEDYQRSSLSSQIGLVFQDSLLFNTSIEENICFTNASKKKNLLKAIKSAELNDFVATLPNGLKTQVAERGSSLSGGQKQRITLARALVLEPKILLLDDFTARVDKQTEDKIFENVFKNYQEITQVVITQQISSIHNFDKIILIMQGEILAQGKHKDLLKNSPEYAQIYNSQMSLA